MPELWVQLQHDFGGACRLTLSTKNFSEIPYAPTNLGSMLQAAQE